jgi:hypothetical protein
MFEKVFQMYGKFVEIFGHQNPGSGYGSGSAHRKNACSGSALNQCVSTTMLSLPKDETF